MAENDVILGGQKLAGPFNLGGWRDLYANPTPNANGAIDLYFTVLPTHLIRLQELKDAMSSDSISASFLPQDSEEFGAFSRTPSVRQVLDKGDERVRLDIARHSSRMARDAGLLALVLSSRSVSDDLFERGSVLTDRMLTNAVSEDSYLTNLNEPVANRALLKASVPRERLEAFLTEYFSSGPTQEVLKSLDVARPAAKNRLIEKNSGTPLAL